MLDGWPVTGYRHSIEGEDVNDEALNAEVVEEPQEDEVSVDAVGCFW